MNQRNKKDFSNQLFFVLRVYFKVVISCKELLQLLLIDSTFAVLKQIVIFHLIYNFYLQFHHKIFHLFAQFLEAIYISGIEFRWVHFVGKGRARSSSAERCFSRLESTDAEGCLHRKLHFGEEHRPAL